MELEKASNTAVWIRNIVLTIMACGGLFASTIALPHFFYDTFFEEYVIKTIHNELDDALTEAFGITDADIETLKAEVTKRIEKLEENDHKRALDLARILTKLEWIRTVQ